MNAIEKLIFKIDSIQNNLLTTVVTVLNENSDELEQAQRDQMAEGKNANGNNIGRLKDRAYALRKKATGGKARLGIADLRNKGNFYKGITAKANKSVLTITSTDEKTDLLINKYTEQIFGYNNQTFGIVRDTIIIPGLIKEFKKQLS